MVIRPVSTRLIKSQIFLFHSPTDGSTTGSLKLISFSATESLITKGMFRLERKRELLFLSVNTMIPIEVAWTYHLGSLLSKQRSAKKASEIGNKNTANILTKLGKFRWLWPRKHWDERPAARFSNVPKLFGWHKSLCIFNKNTVQALKLGSYFTFPYIWKMLKKKQLFTTSES